MMGTFDVTLPINKRVVFPARCVVCEKANPDGMIKLSILGANSTSLTEFAVDTALFGLDGQPRYVGGNSLNKIKGIPACKSCASGLKWYHRLLKIGYYTAWFPPMLLLLTPVPIFITITLVIVCAMSPGIFTLVFPPTFGASFFNGKANFEFKSKLVADEFLALNADATLKKTVAKTETAAAPLNDAAKPE